MARGNGSIWRFTLPALGSATPCYSVTCYSVSLNFVARVTPRLTEASLHREGQERDPKKDDWRGDVGNAKDLLDEAGPDG